MPDMKSFCITCLSNTESGISMPWKITDFLQNTLGFKLNLRKSLSQNFICLHCYRTLCEMKRFYIQLQDVEHYFSQHIVQSIECKQELSQRIKDGNAGSTKTRSLENSKVKTLDQEEVSRKPGKEVNSHEEPTELLLEGMGVEPETEKNISFGDTRFKCYKCFRVFDVHESYEKHLQWHIAHEITSEKSEKQKKVECEICGRLFRTRTQKKNHQVTHTNLRPFKCSICQKTFRQISGLSVHRTVHFGKRVECPECCKRFSTKSEVLKHMNMHKRTSRAYECNSCMQSFSKRVELREHRLTHHERFKCDSCNKMYCNKETLQAHVSIAHNIPDNSKITPTKIVEDLRKYRPNRLLQVTEKSLCVEPIAGDI